MRLRKLIYLVIGIPMVLAGLLALLAACGGSTEKLADLLPLDQQKPTLIYFYTDN